MSGVQISANSGVQTSRSTCGPVFPCPVFPCPFRACRPLDRRVALDRRRLRSAEAPWREAD
eukprot:4532676-Pyramimonas_sp.AAC.1